MLFQSLAITATAVAALAAGSRPAFAENDVRISGPYEHENLAVYFVHGLSAPGPVPLTLAEALERGSMKVLETGEVNELKIENTGSDPVFIQAGDIVKGGRQDRTLTMSMIVPAHSGEIPVAAFCVEHGRWSPRGAEDASKFVSAAAAVPSLAAKLAMRAPMPSASAAAPASSPEYAAGEVYRRQAEVWDSVARTQSKLSSGVDEKVASAVSATSLQLALENEKLNDLRSAYEMALKDAGGRGDDVVGYAFAVNGKLNSADVYASNGLFRKMWSKQLQAAATEAIGERAGKAETVPSADAVKVFLVDAKRAAAKQTVLDAQNRFETRDSEKAVYFAAESASGAFVHENYLAK